MGPPVILGARRAKAKRPVAGARYRKHRFHRHRMPKARAGTLVSVGLVSVRRVCTSPARGGRKAARRVSRTFSAFPVRVAPQYDAERHDVLHRHRCRTRCRADAQQSARVKLASGRELRGARRSERALAEEQRYER